MAGFPSQRSRYAGAGGSRQRRRRPDRPTHDRLGLAHERLEQRTPLAADCYDSFTPYDCSTEAWPSQMDLIAMPCNVAPVDAFLPTGGDDLQPPTSSDCPPEPLSEMPPGYTLAMVPDGAEPMGPLGDQADMWQMMAAMSAVSDVTAGPQAEDEARRVADMQTEMSLFYLNVPRLDAADAIPGHDSMDAPPVPQPDDMTAAEASLSPPIVAVAAAGSWSGELLASECPPVDRTVTPPGEAANEWMPPDLTGLTVSGVTPSRQTAVAIPTYSISTGGMATTFPESVAPYTPALMVSAIHGGVYDPQIVWAAQQEVVESLRWTAMDRAAKAAAREAYDVDDGGLLQSIGVVYSPVSGASPYGRWGFSAHLTYSEETQTYILAFRGTEDCLDLLTDIGQGWFMWSPQFDQAVDLAKEVQRKVGDSPLILAGHSLGGALAAAAAYGSGVNASVFNPASVSLPYRSPLPVQIRSHVIFGDILSIGRTISNGVPSGDIPDPKLRFAPGMIILHLPRSINPITNHSLDSFPD